MVKKLSLDKNIEDSIDFLRSKDIDVNYSIVDLNKEDKFIYGLISQGINDNILRYLIENIFSKEFININDVDYQKIEKTNYGFFYNGNYIVNFKEYYSSSVFYKIKKFYKGKLFNSFIFMESNQKDYMEKQYLKNSREKNSKRKIKIKSDIIKLIDEMILEQVDEIFIDTEKLKIEKNFNSFRVTEKSYLFENINSDAIIQAIDELKTDDYFYKINPKHKIIPVKNSKNSLTIKRYSFYENKDLMSNTQYGEDFIKSIESNSGIFILSQDEDYTYYYDLIDFFENKEDKKVLSFSLNKKSNYATRRANYDEEIKTIEVSSFDYLMIEDISLANKNIYDLINYFSSTGKKIIISVYSKDAINSLSNIIYNYKGINKDVLSSNIGGIYHISKMPKLCEKCRKEVRLRDIDGIRERYPELLKRQNKNTLIHIRDRLGCSNCNSGYKDFAYIEQLIKSSSILSEGIENFNLSRIKDDLSSESNYVSIFEKIEPLIFKDKSVSLYDMKNKI